MAAFRRFFLRRNCFALTLPLLIALLVLMAVVMVVRMAPRHALAEEPATESEAGEPEEPVESGVSLPTDRLKERQLDRARRLIKDGRWSDAATLLDDTLAADRDFFFRPDQRQSTWRSIKTEAARLVAELPPPGREAYALQFRARAERMLQQAIATGDAAGVVEVARRWFHTPAGQRATLLAAISALESNQPLAAAAWLERFDPTATESFEPTLSVMRAIAWWRAGDRDTAVAILERQRTNAATMTRIAGKEVSLSFAPGGAGALLNAIAGEPSAASGRRASEWWLARGDAARNACPTASRPLLVPRYRVPLTRHPEESRLLEKRRKLFADRDTPLLPAGVPVAVDGSIILHTPMGLLAVDFESGKRVWLQTSGAALMNDTASLPDGQGDGTEEGQGDVAGPLHRVFQDGTSGMVSSDGRLVFAIEGDAARQQPAAARLMRGLESGSLRADNVLSAYDIAAKGALRWRKPANDKTADQDAGAVQPWYMGAPLPIGDQLFVLVEEKGEIRLDVLDASSGNLLWSQPLAELDEEQQVDSRETRTRRMSGLSPSFSEGVLVCPTGAGTVVAVDLATRTLLWAYNYSTAGDRPREGIVNGIRVQMGVGRGGIRIAGQLQINGESAATTAGWRDSSPILAAGHVILTPSESEQLHCLDLRSGAVRWTRPRDGAVYVAGVVDGRAFVVGRHNVEAVSLEQGKSVWAKPTALASARVSGRGILTRDRLYLPLDTPEVVEIDLRGGDIAGRSPARGGIVPGNLLAYRGEIVSQGVDSLDVFHQAAPLEERIETALRRQPNDPWGLLWRGQLDLDRGKIVDGLRAIQRARVADPERIPVEMVADAILFGLRRDFVAAAPVWREMSQDGELPKSKSMLGIALDSHLSTGDLADAWQACRQFLAISLEATDDEAAPALLVDGSDPALTVSEPRWFQGRLADLLSKAPPSLRATIDAHVADCLQGASDAPLPPDPSSADLDRWQRCIDYFGTHPAASAVRRSLADAIDRRLADTPREGAAARELDIRCRLLRLQLSQDFADGGAPTPTVEPTSNDLGAAWPLGKVSQQRSGRLKADEMMRLSRVIPIPIDDESRAAVRGLRVGCDVQAQALVATDGFGRRIGDPIAFEPARLGGMNSLFQPMGAEATVIGPVLVVRSGAVFAAFDVPPVGGPKPRKLWMLSESADGPAEMPAVGFPRQPSGRLRRNGTIPLGARVSEPNGVAAPAMAPAMRALANGVAISVDRSLELRDAATGAVLWQRHRLPVTGDLLGDERFLCVCPRDGKGAVVVSTTDGRIVRTCDLPPHELRVAACGRRLVVLELPAANAAANTGRPPRVKLELLDSATLERTPLGEYAPDARTILAGADELAIVEPAGAFTVLDLRRGAVRFQSTLTDMPAGLEQVQVIPWQDRFLVIVGRRETPQEQKQYERLGLVVPLPQMVPGEEHGGGPLTGSIWAVSRDSGEMLWPVPATIVRHSLHRHQPGDLPILLFARQIQPGRDGDRTRLSILALDKRTGHAVHVDDKIMSQPHIFAGCDMIGDPEKHTITLARTGSESPELRLDFTGEPMAPRPPYQAAAKPPVTGDLLTELEYWLQKALAIPLPF
jgi:hypothetical protein